MFDVINSRGLLPLVNSVVVRANIVGVMANFLEHDAIGFGAEENVKRKYTKNLVQIAG